MSLYFTNKLAIYTILKGLKIENTVVTFLKKKKINEKNEIHEHFFGDSFNATVRFGTLAECGILYNYYHFTS